MSLPEPQFPQLESGNTLNASWMGYSEDDMSSCMFARSMTHGGLRAHAGPGGKGHVGLGWKTGTS